MTAPLPLLFAEIPQEGALPRARGANPGAALNGESAFGRFLGALAHQGQGAESGPSSLQQVLAGLSSQSGKSLPPSLSLEQLTELLQSAGLTDADISGVLSPEMNQLDLSSLEALIDGSGSSGDQGLSAELTAFLRSLLNPELQAARHNSMPSAGGQQGEGTAQSNQTVLEKLLEHLNFSRSMNSSSSETETRHAAQAVAHAADNARAAPPLSSEQLAQLRTLLIQAANDSATRSDTKELLAALQMDSKGAEAKSLAGGNDFIQKLIQRIQKSGVQMTPGRVDAGNGHGAAKNAIDYSSMAGVSGSQLAGIVQQAGVGGLSSTSSQMMSVPVPFNQPNWDQALSQNVLWMAKQGIQSASMRLNPPHLGPLEVRISFNNEQASVTFLSQHAVVREAVEATLPRLREMLGDSGISLGDADVSDGSAPEQQMAESGHGALTGHASGMNTATHEGVEELDAGETGQPDWALGMVDFYA